MAALAWEAPPGYSLLSSSQLPSEAGCGVPGLHTRKWDSEEK